MDSLTWKKKGSFVNVFDKNIFVIDSKNNNSSKIDKTQETLVILHGYPTSSFDYHKVLEDLSKEYRVIIHDHLGFGFSDKTKVTDTELEEMWIQLENNEGRKVIHPLTNYINERYYYWHRWVGALKETQIPTKII